MAQLDLVELIKAQADDFWWLQMWATMVFFGLCCVEALASGLRAPARPTPDLITDMFYWLLSPALRVLSRTLVVLVLLPLSLTLQVYAGPELLDGFGPIAEQPPLLIVIELFFLMDLASYWSHRLFHTVPALWRFHALHHSAKYVRWATTGRVHPVNEVINYLVVIVPFFLVGFPLGAILPLLPAIMIYALMAHTQWDLSFGPLRHVLVSPRFHRWHHTHSNEGGNKNFANVFSLWDRLFGTYYLPQGERPLHFGLDDEDIEENYWTHLLYPFRRRRDAVGQHDAGEPARVPVPFSAAEAAHLDAPPGAATSGAQPRSH